MPPSTTQGLNDTQRTRLRALGAARAGKTIASPLAAPPPSTPISTQSLAPTAPMVLPQIAPATQTDSALEYLGQTALKSDADRVAELDRNAKGSKDDFLSSYLSSPTESGATAQLYQQLGVNDSEKELTEINNQIIAEQHALLRRVQAIEKNPNGLFGPALEQEIQKAKDESLYRQADMSIIQLAKQGKYDSARTIADRSVSALMEATYKRNEALKMVYEDNRDAFTKAEQRLFETKQKERETEAANREYRMRAEFDQKIKMQDPAYKLDLALKGEQIRKTRAEAAKAEAEASGAGSIVVTDSSGQTIAIKPEEYQERNDTINLINQALNDKNFGFAVGAQKLNPFTYIPGLPHQAVKAQLKQITAKLALGERDKLKGSGAVSDFEARTLERSASSFNTDLGESAAKNALIQVRGALTTMNGGQAQVLVKDPKTNQAQTAYADSAAINKMIQDGLVVEYQ